ncbi:MAG: MBL fold metallo-hydrolase, partial [Ignavibacteriae bacterium]
MKEIKSLFILIIIIFMLDTTFAQQDYSNSEITKVILLGTGNPNPDPE